ncbi:hypothetical protein MtrunA17_Chr8g0380861 [Medicago truncatula]|uniref:Uncharacterized protein n=1 Tax=Medicago truncatula TaxID=3880 RepID=A0A396GR12_MEDTR|nr:hypothetical protein MtrunA17_Chr8g0380861 [Medicago truncatula]
MLTAGELGLCPLDSADTYQYSAYDHHLMQQIIRLQALQAKTKFSV